VLNYKRLYGLTVPTVIQ